MGNALHKRVCVFHGPTTREYVEVCLMVTGEFAVYRVRPFPPPTRGDTVERFDAHDYMDAVTLGARLARDMNDANRTEYLKKSLPEDWNKPDGVESL